MAKKQRGKEIKGLLLLGIGFLLLLSLFSFVQGDYTQNFLGFVGYVLSWLLQYFLGFGSYLLVFFLLWLGWKLLFSQEIESFFLHIFCFVTAIVSLCILLNVFAESHSSLLQFIQKKMYTETVQREFPFPHLQVRYNLGGVPFYYLYKDIPYFNLQKLFSDVGIVLLFSLITLVSSYLFFEIKLSPDGIKRFLIQIGLHLQKGKNLLQIALEKGYAYCNHQIQLLTVPKKKPVVILSPASFSSTYYPKTLSLPAPKVEEDPFVKEKKEKIKKAVKEAVMEPTIFPKKNSSFLYPPLSLLSPPPKNIDPPLLKKELRRQAEVLEETLKSFGIEARVGEIHSGPTILSFEVHPSVGVKVQKITALESDIALNLQAKAIRIIAPIPGKAAVGVEIPSPYPQTVSFYEMLHHYQQTKRKHIIPLLLGKTVSGEHVVADLAKMPHCLIAGATGSGKSVCINTIVMSILMNSHPDEIKLLLIDPKKVELTQYSELPHMLAPVITEPHGAYAALHYLVKEMQTRYEILKQLGLRNILSFNNRVINKDLEASLSIPIPEKLPFIVAIIDEFADLMMASSSDLETPIARIAQMARAVGIHLILATQRPSREVITGIIKANIPSRIAFKVASRVNSQIILDEIGAESLLGNGDLLFAPPGTSQLLRAQGAYISDEEINQVVSHICKQSPPCYAIPSFDSIQKVELSSDSNDAKDKLYDQALSLVLVTKIASTTYLQRKLKIGYARAASLMDELQENGVIGPQDGSKARKVLGTSSMEDIL
ncbi:MAG: DNA translocase FtsK 4TM domain-containing protein [Chlamydiota bacterium]